MPLLLGSHRIAHSLIYFQPTNYFQDIEQAAFSPSTMVPGIAPTADPSKYFHSHKLTLTDANTSVFKVLQARMFAYPDAARYRLGVNYQQLPCNAPVSEVYNPYQRDGASRYKTNFGDDPNYVGASLKQVHFKGKVGANGYSVDPHEEWVGSVAGYASQVTDDDFVQARELWKVLGKSNEQDDFVENVAGHLGSAIPRVQEGAISKFTSFSNFSNFWYVLEFKADIQR